MNNWPVYLIIFHELKVWKSFLLWYRKNFTSNPNFLWFHFSLKGINLEIPLFILIDDTTSLGIKIEHQMINVMESERYFLGQFHSVLIIHDGDYIKAWMWQTRLEFFLFISRDYFHQEPLQLWMKWHKAGIEWILYWMEWVIDHLNLR